MDGSCVLLRRAHEQLKVRTLENPMGNVDYKPVAEGNLHASVAAFLYALACLRGILPVVENPAGSLIFRFPALQSVVAFFSAGSAVCCRCVFANERMGRRFKKAYKLVGHVWVKHLCAPCKCKGGLHCSLVYWAVRHGKVHFSGRKELLRESAAYPPRKGEDCTPHVAGAWIFILDIEQRSGGHPGHLKCLLVSLEDTSA